MAALCGISSFLQPLGRKSELCEGRCVRYFASRHELVLPMLQANWTEASPAPEAVQLLGEDVEPQPRLSAGLVRSGLGLC